MVNISMRQLATQGSPQPRSEGPWYRMLNSMVHWIACFSISIAVVGCGSQEDHHEDEHLEHFVPAHKPADYSALVEQLEKRIAQQSKPSGSADNAQSATARQELNDIIGWIPELAADSELRKQEFENAVSAASRLSIALGFEKPADGATLVDQSAIPKLLEELKTLVSKSQTSTEPM